MKEKKREGEGNLGRKLWQKLEMEYEGTCEELGNTLWIKPTKKQGIKLMESRKRLERIGQKLCSE